MCGLVLCGSWGGMSLLKNAPPPPSRQRATWLSACRRREKRPSSSTRQTKWGGCREGPLASDIGSFSHGTGEPRRRLEHKISLHKVASEVRHIVIFNNGSTTGPNGVSELSLAPHKHSPAEVARNRSRLAVGCALVSPALAAGLPLAAAEQDHQLHGAKKNERKCCLLVTCRHTHKKNRAWRVLVAVNEPIFRVLAPMIAQLLSPALLSGPSVSKRGVSAQAIQYIVPATPNSYLGALGYLSPLSPVRGPAKGVQLRRVLRQRVVMTTQKAQADVCAPPPPPLRATRGGTPGRLRCGPR
jgi:hypothetical protein